jgi:predicted N-formylglutamate amidohydrolase
MNRNRQIILSCEHAGNKVPPRYQSLFAASRNILSTHRAYDIGIAPIASVMHKLLACPLCQYDNTRLLINVNRSSGRSLFSEFSRPLPQAEKQHLIDAYYMPYRNRLYQMVGKKAANAQMLHLSLHSFSPVLKGNERTADIGILYDPSRQSELQFACDLRQCLKSQTGLRIRRNYPYLGRSDGMTSWLRRQFQETKYLGIEIECNQMLLAAESSGELARQFANAIVKIDKSIR